MIKKKKEFHENLGPLVGMITKAMRRQLNRRLIEAGVDVTAEQLIIMSILEQHNGCNQQLIAEVCGKDKTSTTRMIDTMERNGLVKRIPDPDDRRQNRILLTEKGYSVQEQMMTHIYATHENAARGIPPEEMDAVKEVLKKVLNNLIEDDPSWPGPKICPANKNESSSQ